MHCQYMLKSTLDSFSGLSLVHRLSIGEAFSRSFFTLMNLSKVLVDRLLDRLGEWRG